MPTHRKLARPSVPRVKPRAASKAAVSRTTDQDTPGELRTVIAATVECFRKGATAAQAARVAAAAGLPVSRRTVADIRRAVAAADARGEIATFLVHKGVEAGLLADQFIVFARHFDGKAASATVAIAAVANDINAAASALDNVLLDLGTIAALLGSSEGDNSMNQAADQARMVVQKVAGSMEELRSTGLHAAIEAAQTNTKPMIAAADTLRRSVAALCATFEAAEGVARGRMAAARDAATQGRTEIFKYAQSVAIAAADHAALTAVVAFQERIVAPPRATAKRVKSVEPMHGLKVDPAISLDEEIVRELQRLGRASVDARQAEAAAQCIVQSLEARLAAFQGGVATARLEAAGIAETLVGVRRLTQDGDHAVSHCLDAGKHAVHVAAGIAVVATKAGAAAVQMVDAMTAIARLCESVERRKGRNELVPSVLVDGVRQLQRAAPIAAAALNGAVQKSLEACAAAGQAREATAPVVESARRVRRFLAPGKPFDARFPTGSGVWPGGKEPSDATALARLIRWRDPRVLSVLDALHAGAVRWARTQQNETDRVATQVNIARDQLARAAARAQAMEASLATAEAATRSPR